MAAGQQIEFPFPVPIVSAIIERPHAGQMEVLLQTRWKPNRDPLYSGTFEIPCGGLDPQETVYDALRREVFEETGLRVTGFRPDVKTPVHSRNGDDVFAFVPFCCQQQTSGLTRVGFVFVCTVADGDPVPAPAEVKDIAWVPIPGLRQLLARSPERFFTLQVPVLQFYLDQFDAAGMSP